MELVTVRLNEAKLKRIIDNKKVDLTDSEFQLYQELVKAYTTPNNRGEEYFKDLFETDKEGIIIFLKPPSKAYSSMECWLFLVSVFVHQHVGLAATEVESFLKEGREVLVEARALIDELKSCKN